MYHSKTYLASGLVLSLILSACGGGGGPASSATQLTGAVVDGYIEGANVCLDVNNNQTCDTDEPSTITLADGSYKLDTSAVTATQIAKAHLLVTVPTTAKDADDNGQTLAQAGKASFTLMSPASQPNIISPLTTLVSHQLINDSGKSLDDAQTAVRNQLGLKPSDDVMQDIGKIKSTDANVNIKNTAVAVALGLGEIRKAIDAGNAVSGTSGTSTTEQQKTLATLSNLQSQITTLLGNLNTASNKPPKPADVQTGLKTKTDELKTASGATTAISGTVQTTSSAANLLTGASFYSGELCANAQANSACTPQMHVTTISATGGVLETNYSLANNAWGAGTPSSYDALNTTSNTWVKESGGAGNFLIDSSGTAGTYTATLSGEKTRVVMRQTDLSGKDISSLTSLGTAPLALNGLVFPAGSIQYFGQFTKLTDQYRLWNSGGSNPYLTDVNYDVIAHINVTTKFTSLSQWMGTYSTGNTNGKCWYGFNNNGNNCFLFDASSSATGGTISVYAGNNNGGTLQNLGTGTYEIRTFGAVKVLVITQLPMSAAYSASNGLNIYSEKDGFAVGGTLYPAGVVSSQDSDGRSFNKTAFAAIVNKLSGPAVP